jgi:hypothetical protein
MEEQRAQLVHLSDPNQFRQRILAVANQKDVERDLRKAQSSCRLLDVQKVFTSTQFRLH